MQLAASVVEILLQAVAQRDQLSQRQPNLGRRSLTLCSLLCGEAGDQARIDLVGLRPNEFLFRIPTRAKWVDEHHGEPPTGELDVDVLPVMSGRLHGDDRVVWCAEH